MRRPLIATLLAFAALSAPALAAPPQPGAYQQDDAKGFYDILPSGQNGLDNPGQLLGFEASGSRPKHNDDQLQMYANLVYGAPGLQPQDLTKYYKTT